MELANKVAVVTGGGSGIGRALCAAFAGAGARGIVVADLDGQQAQAVAASLRGADGAPVGAGFAVDVADEAQLQQLVRDATERFGQIDLFCSNAGIIARADEDASQRSGSATGTST